VPECGYFYFAGSPSSTPPFQNWHKPWDWNNTTWQSVWYTPWAYDPNVDRSGWYYGTFTNVMPDLAFWDFAKNDWNKPVVDAIDAFFKKWSGLKADGFRIDAAQHLVEGADNNIPTKPNNLQLLRNYLKSVRAQRAGTSFIAEVYSDTGSIEQYLPDATDMVLDFPFMYAVREGLDWQSNNADSLRQVLAHYEATQDRIPAGHRVVFAGNHDVSRLWTQYNGDESKIRMAHFVALLAPQTPALYYGEEIGMTGSVTRANPEDDGSVDQVGTDKAFAWDGDSPSLGFTGGVAPVQGAADNWKKNNLKAMRAGNWTLFQFVKAVIALRKGFPITAKTKLHVSQAIYGDMTGYTMVTPGENGAATRCRTVVVNMSTGGPWNVELKHTGDECQGAALREAWAENAKSVSSASGSVTYAFSPYGRVVLDGP
jgi:glycosidase